MKQRRQTREYERKVADLRKLVALDSQSSDEGSGQRVALASYQLGHVMYQNGNYGEALENLSRAAAAIERFPDLLPIGMHVEALRVGALLALGRYSEVVVVTGELLRTGLDPDLSGVPQELHGVRWRDYIADSWSLRTVALERLDRPDDAYACDRALIDEFGASESEQQNLLVTRALLRCAKYVRGKGDLLQALDLLGQAETRCGSQEIRFVRTECHVLAERASVLEESGDVRGAYGLRERLVTRFRTVKDAEVKEAVEQASQLIRWMS